MGTCGIIDIEEMSQHFCDRRNHNQRDVMQEKMSNVFYDHLERNEEQVINWEKVCVFKPGKKNWKGRKI